MKTLDSAVSGAESYHDNTSLGDHHRRVAVTLLLCYQCSVTEATIITEIVAVSCRNPDPAAAAAAATLAYDFHHQPFSLTAPPVCFFLL